MKCGTKSSSFFVLAAAAVFSLSSQHVASAESLSASRDFEQSDQSLLEYCRSVGFDPWQLSCETCDLLPTRNNIQKNCNACCQSYKTSERMTKPYESAVLVHRDGSSSRLSHNADSEMDQFLNEHWNDLVKQKGSNRLSKLVRDDSASSARFMLMRPPSQMLLWFDTIVEPGLKMKEYKEAAKEIIYLDGYKKDDMKDMLSTLLPDKK